MVTTVQARRFSQWCMHGYMLSYHPNVKKANVIKCMSLYVSSTSGTGTGCPFEYFRYPCPLSLFWMILIIYLYFII